MATLGLPPWSLLCTLAALLAALWCAGRALAGSWLGPRRLARAMRSQGIRGTSYRFPFGDMEYMRLVAAACSQPMPLPSHAVAARAVPFDHGVIKEHGKIAQSWFGPEPRVVVSDPQLFREILSNKHGQFGKQKSILRIERLMANGVTTHQGDKWFAHPRIINHAFHLEKLKDVTGFCSLFKRIGAEMGNSVGPGDVQEKDVWPEFQNLTGRDGAGRGVLGPCNP